MDGLQLRSNYELCIDGAAAVGCLVGSDPHCVVAFLLVPVHSGGDVRGGVGAGAEEVARGFAVEEGLRLALRAFSAFGGQGLPSD